MEGEFEDAWFECLEGLVRVKEVVRNSSVDEECVKLLREVALKLKNEADRLMLKFVL